VRNNEATNTVLRVKSRGTGEASHLGAVDLAGGGRRTRPLSSTDGGPRPGQPTSGNGLRWSKAMADASPLVIALRHRALIGFVVVQRALCGSGGEVDFRRFSVKSGI
jgi:hypothetical protein